MAVFSLCLVVAVVAAIIYAKFLESSKKEQPFASSSKLPGPKGLPLIGNVHELPAKCSWMKFHEWGLQYGPIYQVNLAGTNHVWISRDKIAHDLLSKRSAIYSDRPFIPGLEHDNRTSGQYLPLMSKNLVWSRQRRFAKQIMDRSQKDNFYSYPELEAIRLLFELMTDPSKYNTAMESFVARVTSRLAWGTPAPANELKQRARELLIGVSPTGAFGNKLPAVMSLPEKIAPPKAWETRRGRTERKFFETMQDEVRQALIYNDANKRASLLPTLEPKQSWTRMFLENKGSWGFSSDLEGAYAVGMHGIAGALTIAAPMQSFCLALCHYPQHQAILHEEIDRVLGDRLPTFTDMPEMPVLRAFIRETLRWRPPVPTGIPHEVSQDDVYEGYHIPKGSVIHPLEWSISRDPEVFIDPDEWNPLRWLESKYPTYQDPLSKFPTITNYSQFGYGRRTCLGMGVTEADMFVGLGSVAWLFSISAGEKDEDDEDVPEPEPMPQRSESVSDVASIPAEPVAEPATPKSSRRSSNASDCPSRPETSHGSPSHVSLSHRLTIHGNDATLNLPPSERKRLSLLTNDSAVSPQRSEFRSPFTLHGNDSAISVTSSLGGHFRDKLTVHRNDSAISMGSSYTLQRNDSTISIPGEFPGTAPFEEASSSSPKRILSDGVLLEEPLPTLSEKSEEQQYTNYTEFPFDRKSQNGEFQGEITPEIQAEFDAHLRAALEIEVDISTYTTPDLPGCWSFPDEFEPGAPTEIEPPKPEMPDYEHDSTFNFSTLLIAKPLPFKFTMKIRNQERAKQIAQTWIDQNLAGEFADSRMYWKNDNQGDRETGWGEVFN